MDITLTHKEFIDLVRMACSTDERYPWADAVEYLLKHTRISDDKIVVTLEVA